MSSPFPLDERRRYVNYAELIITNCPKTGSEIVLTRHFSGTRHVDRYAACGIAINRVRSGVMDKLLCEVEFGASRGSIVSQRALSGKKSQ